ncbi:MAG: hypothetical protein HOD00_02165 [Gemmatimonadales bacterium]|jgi:hypothetical protein|nr:hypothetical protein [Gemmatimonadales bacterium]MBT3776318.1 hypothetical protein [Gemmatimonadales bacterium]MBT3958924.1 hypothetical protein [Gemmatimonadales bacterium]MBT4188535.1 hypothetical protein [Gemmatimonadales bacterium]MBT4436319.1 hypothetical protein [Gemmatimonadales bacterium]
MKVTRVVGAVVAVLMTVGISWMSRAPFEFGADGEALIRLSWRVDGVTVEACRTLSEEELADLPIHMRNPDACIGQMAPFVFRATLSGVALVNDTLSPGGARGDRPIYVLRDLSVAPGRHDLTVHFDAIVPEGADVGDAIVAYTWEGEIELTGGTVALLTLDDRGAFVLRQPDG